MKKTIEFIYRNKAGKLMNTQTIGSRLVNAVVANTIEEGTETSVIVYEVPEYTFTTDDLGTITIAHTYTEADGDKIYHVSCNYHDIECMQSELSKAITMCFEYLMQAAEEMAAEEAEVMQEIEEEMQEAPVETIENEIVETVETENGDTYIIETNKGYQGNIETYLLKKNGRIIYESYNLNEVLDYMNGRIYAGDIQQEYTSAETSVNDKKIPVVFSTLINKADKLNIRLDMTSIFDTGCGKYINHISEYCSKNLVRYFGRDKYNQPEEVNNAWINDIYGVYLNDDNHIFTSSNVLNVIKGENCRKQYINDIVKYMQAGEKLYITVYEGNKSGRGKVTKKDCWQENRKLASYIPEVKNCGFSEVTMKYGMIIATL